MSKKAQPDVFMSTEKLYLIISLAMLGVSLILFGAVALILQIPAAMPGVIIAFTLYFLISHGGFVLWGIGRILKFLFSIRPKHSGEVTIWRTLLGIIISPLSAFISYMAFFLMALSSCAAD